MTTQGSPSPAEETEQTKYGFYNAIGAARQDMADLDRWMRAYRDAVLREATAQLRDAGHSAAAALIDPGPSAAPPRSTWI
ncbi:hypothetical protein ACWGCW_01150 [Streptomyces sp. NPDC054933]